MGFTIYLLTGMILQVVLKVSTSGSHWVTTCGSASHWKQPRCKFEGTASVRPWPMGWKRNDAAMSTQGGSWCWISVCVCVPSWPNYPPGNGYISHLGKFGKSSSKCHFLGDMLVSWRVIPKTIWSFDLLLGWFFRYFFTMINDSEAPSMRQMFFLMNYFQPSII